LAVAPLADDLLTLHLSEHPLASHYCADAQAMLFAPGNVIEG